MVFCPVSLKGGAFCCLVIKGTKLSIGCEQLPDPNAKSFTFHVLKDAMLATIAAINKFHEDAGITEVSLWQHRSG